MLSLNVTPKYVYYVDVFLFKRFLSPEFIPPRQRTDPLKFFVERKDMIRRRKVLNIPEFYAGRRPDQTFFIFIEYLKVVLVFV